MARALGNDCRAGIVRALQACLIMAVSGAAFAQPFQLMTRSTSGETANSGLYNSSSPAVTPDGRYVVFESNATNLVTPATANVQQIFLRDRMLGVTELISVNALGASADKPVYRPAISADGCRVVFWTDATNLSASTATAAGFYDVFLRDRCALTTTTIGNGNASSKNPDISADGHLVVFESNATNFTVMNTNLSSQIYMRDLSLPSHLQANILITLATTGGGVGSAGNSPSLLPAVSADGSRIAFWSVAYDLVPGDLNSAWDIFLWDAATAAASPDGYGVSLVSRAADGTQRNQGNESTSRIVEPAISADGRYVSFATTSTNLVPCQISVICNQNVFVKDTQTGGIVLASVTSAGVLGNGESPSSQGERAALSGDGSQVIFTTSASNLPSDGISFNVVMHSLVSGETVTFTPHTAFGVGARPAISGDAAGRVVAFFSTAHLDPNFASASGVFLHDRFSRARADFNGDGRSDVFWLHATLTQTYEWQMNGTAIASSGSPASTGDTGWRVAGLGDFNGDGKADVLFRHAVSGTTVVWLMDGTAIAGSGSPGTIADLGWQVEGVGDFNGDGKADLLWMHSDGTVVLWFMNGATPTTAAVAALGAGSGWSVQGIGDFNGDGKADILWRHSSGTMFVWLMNGATISSSGSPASVGPLTATGWLVQGVGDFDGDGKADILWRNDDLGGIIYVWLMNGAVIANSNSVTGVGTAAAQGWIVKGVGDYNGDGKVDVFWKNDLTLGGITYVWLMNGTGISSFNSVTGVPDTDWQVQNPK